MNARHTGTRLLAQLIDSYILCCDTEGKSHDTTRWYRQKLDAFVTHLAQKTLTPSLNDLDTDSVRGSFRNFRVWGGQPLRPVVTSKY